MKSRLLLASLIFMVYISLGINGVNAQNTKREPDKRIKVNHDSNDEKLKMMSIRLEVDNSVGKKGAKFKIAPDSDVVIRVLGKTSDDRTIGLGYADKQFIQFRPLLLNAGNIVLGFKASAKEKYKREWAEVERRKSPGARARDSGPGSGFFGPNRENLIGFLRLSEYYNKLEPGIYRISLLLGFGEDENENKIQSKVITFEIVSEFSKK